MTYTETRSETSSQPSDPLGLLQTEDLTEAEVATISRSLKLRLSSYIPTIPFPKQHAFLLLYDTREVLYGGAAGPGKSEGLLMEASRDVDDYPTQALIIRRTYKDLAQPGGLIHRSHQWWRNTKAHWDGTNFTWRFPSGATVSFGYMEHEGDELRYQGGEYHVVCFDELTQIRESQYLYLFTRTRRVEGFPVPPRVRSASNPGGPGHEWVRKRWNLPYGPAYPLSKTRKYIGATLDDNPYLDQEDYEASLQILADTADGNSVTYEQLRHGDWSAQASGGFLDPRRFKQIGWKDVPEPHQFELVLRYWDFAATQPSDLNPNPDWTAGVKIGRTLPKGREIIDPRTGNHIIPTQDYYIFDINRFRTDPGNVELEVKSTARRDGAGVAVWVEQERGSAGKSLVWRFQNDVLPGYHVHGLYATSDKETRAKAVANLSTSGHIYLVEGPWVDDFLAEVGAFPEGDHDDQIDAVSNGIICLERQKRMYAGGEVKRVGGLKSKRQKKVGHYGY